MSSGANIGASCTFDLSLKVEGKGNGPKYPQYFDLIIAGKSVRVGESITVSLGREGIG